MFRKWWQLMDQADGGDAGGAGGGGDVAGGDAAAADAGDAGKAVAADAGDAGKAVAGDQAGADKGAAADKAGDKGAAAGDAVKPIWPDDWRKQLAAGDETEVKRLGRFLTPADIYKSYRALEQRLSSGELKTTLPKDAKPEEIAQWRKDNDIPDAPDKYDLKFDDGLVIGDEDKPLVAEFLKSAHAANFTPAQAKAAVGWYFADRERQAEAVAQQDETDRQAVLDKLNGEWGSSYRQNINMVSDVLNHFPESIRDALRSARLPGGKALFNDPDVIRGFATVALEINPAATLVPAGAGDVGKMMHERIAEIESKMGTKAYKKDEAMQAEYRELITARDKMQQRKAA